MQPTKVINLRDIDDDMQVFNLPFPITVKPVLPPSFGGPLVIESVACCIFAWGHKPV